MQGIICIWSGAVVDIPAGWALCDGTNGTPALQNRMIVGAGDTYTPGQSGGTTAHTHTFTSNTHNHSLPVDGAIGPGTTFASTSTSQTVSGTTDSTDHRPKYYALAFIMKL